MIPGYDQAQQRYDNQMPDDPPKIEEWRIRDRMLSDYAKLLPMFWYEPMECFPETDAAKVKTLIQSLIESKPLPGDHQYRVLGYLIMSGIEKFLRKEAIYELESGDIDRSLGS